MPPPLEMAAFMDDPVAAGYSKRDILLSKAGWMRPQLQANDDRQVAPLNPTMTLHQVRTKLSNRNGSHRSGNRVSLRNDKLGNPAVHGTAKKGQKAPEGQRNLRDMVMKKTPQEEDSHNSSAAFSKDMLEVQNRLFQNLRDDMVLGGPAAVLARNNLAQTNPALLAKMMARKEKEEKKAETRGRRLNSMGILDEQVNNVRNRNMQRVSLRKGLTGAALAKEEAPAVDPFAGLVSLEDRLSELLEVVTLVVDGIPEEPKSLFDQNLAGAAAQMVMAQRWTPARQHELEAITSKALGRYRQRVHEEQVKLLEELGLNLQRPDSWVGTLEQREEQRLAEEAEAEMEKNLPSTLASNTEELMDVVLNRLSQIEERMAAHEDLMRQQEAARKEADSDEDSEGGYGGGFDTNRRSRHQQAFENQASTSRVEQEVEEVDPFDDGVRPRRLPDNWTPGGGIAKGGRPLRPDQSIANVLSADGSHTGPAGPGTGYGATFYFPDEEEFAAAPAPHLPAILQLGSMTSADVLQARLERIWGLLEMPMMGKLDMVIKYTAKEFSSQLEEALEIWESGAASVVEREKLLSAMVDIQENMDSGNISKSLINKKSITDVCMGFLYMSYSARRANSLLKSRFYDKLTYQGLEYPGADAVSDDQLEAFVQRAFDMTIQPAVEELDGTNRENL